MNEQICCMGFSLFIHMIDDYPLSYLYLTDHRINVNYQECVANLFSSLCSVLLKKENQEKFLACEGMELMVRCINEQKFSAGKDIGCELGWMLLI